MHDWAMGALGGLMIGTAAALYLLLNGRIMGASSILGAALDGSDRPGRPERLAFLAGLVAVPAALHAVFPAATGLSGNLLLVAAAGLLVGLGTRLAGGCTSGHGVCGLSRLAPRGIAATAIYLAAGAATMAVGRHALGLF